MIIRGNNRAVYVAMSGGVDSSVAAALLQERGFDVRGVHIKMWSDPSIPCRFKEDRHDAMRVAEKLAIPFETWDFTDEYRHAVVDYMIREYAAGRTPNPDIMCNRHIKFGVFLERARARGGNYMATGHYVRRQPEHPISYGDSLRVRERRIKDYTLNIAKDEDKDQSYFLWTLTQEQLEYCVFPLGGYKKAEVREMARARGLATAEKKDSQGICFIGEINIKDFLGSYIPQSPGPVQTVSGAVVGRHDGLPFYTIGQRGGMSIGGGIPYYVTKKDHAANALIVSEGPYADELFSRELAAAGAHWISGRKPRIPFECEARIRYRQPLQKCVLKTARAAENMLHIEFKEPQRAVTPGQSVVFYRGGEMLGGAWIGGQ